ncbi:MAG: hypothetical protein RLZZ175_2797 [Bacteroidota bacterium]|jgi:hypothetical protein
MAVFNKTEKQQKIENLRSRVAFAKQYLPKKNYKSMFVAFDPACNSIEFNSKISTVLLLRSTDERITEMIEAIAMFNLTNSSTEC